MVQVLDQGCHSQGAGSVPRALTGRLRSNEGTRCGLAPAVCWPGTLECAGEWPEDSVKQSFPGRVLGSSQNGLKGLRPSSWAGWTEKLCSQVLRLERPPKPLGGGSCSLFLTWLTLPPAAGTTSGQSTHPPSWIIFTSV